MPDIFLLIPDMALREAVVEQIVAAKLGAPRVIDSAQAFPKPKNGTTPIIIIDDAGSDKKTEAFARCFDDAQDKPIVLMLGGEGDIEGVSETFFKPFRLGHLITRLKYYLETTSLLRNRIVTFGPYRLESQNRRVLRDNEADPIRLTEKETALLVYLAQNKTPSTRQDILANVWGYDERIDTHTLETHIYQLRRKLDREGENWLLSEAGAYRLAGIKE